MYLEIATRQSGKTTRLINQIYADKKDYKLQILMGMGFESLKPISKKIKQNNKVRICLSFKSFEETLREKKIVDMSQVRLYVDEFLYSNAFCNQFDQFVTKYKPLIQNGYYSSSINSNNTNIYHRLAELNESVGTVVASVNSKNNVL